MKLTLRKRFCDWLERSLTLCRADSRAKARARYLGVCVLLATLGPICIALKVRDALAWEFSGYLDGFAEEARRYWFHTPR